MPGGGTPAPGGFALGGGAAGGAGFLTSLSRPALTTSSSRGLSTSTARGRLRSRTQYELPSAITSITVGDGVAVPDALRSIVIVAVGFDASRFGSAGAVSSIVAT